MKVKQGRDITKIARELAEGNPLGYNKIRAMLKKAAPLSRQRFYQVKHKLMGLCAKCSEPLAQDSVDYCAYHKRATAARKAVAAREKRKGENTRENEALIKFAQEREKTFKREGI